MASTGAPSGFRRPAAGIATGDAFDVTWDHCDRSAEVTGLRDILDPIVKWWTAGETFGLATVVQTWGSSPRPVGSQMAIADDPIDYLCRFLPAPDQLKVRSSGEERMAAQA